MEGTDQMGRGAFANGTARGSQGTPPPLILSSEGRKKGRRFRSRRYTVYSTLTVAPVHYVASCASAASFGHHS